MNLAMPWGDPGCKPTVGAVAAPRRGDLTHEAFCHAVRDLAVSAATVSPEQRATMLDAKMVYGIGTGSYRGVCHYKAWNGEAAMIEIAASGEESAVQLAGTTIHETAHALAGWQAGHGAEWKAACRTLGLMDAVAAGQVYTPEGFEPALWAKIEALGEPGDGKPSFGLTRGPVPVAATPRPCPMGRGTRGGKSFGKGSGSRLRLWECGCGVKVRVASDDFRAHCDKCGGTFDYKGK